MSESYSKREQDLLHKELKKDVKEVKDMTHAGFSDLKQETTDIREQLNYTNGKIRKITVALIFAFGMIIGLGATNFQSVVKILI